MGEIHQIAPELQRQRLVEAELVTYLIIGGLTGVVADDLQHPINRRQRRERKGHQQQAEQRQGQRQQSLKQREQGAFCAPLCSGR